MTCFCVVLYYVRIYTHTREYVCYITLCMYSNPYAGFTKGGLHQGLHRRYSLQFHVI